MPDIDLPEAVKSELDDIYSASFLEAFTDTANSHPWLPNWAMSRSEKEVLLHELEA